MQYRQIHAHARTHARTHTRTKIRKEAGIKKKKKKKKEKEDDGLKKRTGLERGTGLVSRLQRQTHSLERMTTSWQGAPWL